MKIDKNNIGEKLHKGSAYIFKSSSVSSIMINIGNEEYMQYSFWKEDETENMNVSNLGFNKVLNDHRRRNFYTFNLEKNNED